MSFFAGLIQGLGGAIGQQQRDKLQRDYQDKEFERASLMALAKDPMTPRGHKRQILGKLLGPKYADTIASLVPDFQVHTGNYQAQSQEFDVAEQEAPPAARMPEMPQMALGSGPVVSDGGQAPAMSGGPQGQSSYGQDPQQEPISAAQSPMGGIEQLFGMNQESAPITRRATGGIVGNPPPAMLEVQRMTKMMRAMPARPVMKSSLEMSDFDLQEAAQNRQLSQRYSREDAVDQRNFGQQKELAGMQIEAQRQARIAQGWRPSPAGVRVDPSTGQRTLDWVNVEIGAQKTMPLGTHPSEEDYEQKMAEGRRVEQAAMQPIVSRAFQIMEASGGKIGFDQAKMQAGQEANLSESMKLALQQMDLRNAASLIASRQHEMTKPDNTERIVRGEERRRVEDAVAQARQVAAQYRVALSKMDLADQAMASPEAKKATRASRSRADRTACRS
jgi:hypothetical protein